jgi:hypothetical protein
VTKKKPAEGETEAKRPKQDDPTLADFGIDEAPESEI